MESRNMLTRTLGGIALLLAAAPVFAADRPELPTETKAQRYPKATNGQAFLKDATLLPGDGPQRDHVSILVKDGKIAALLPADAQPPEGVPVFDCSGKFVSPGIIDCHAHIIISSGVNEGTDSVTAEVRIGDQLDGEDVAMYRALAGGATAAQLLHGSANAIGGQSAVVKFKFGSPGSDLLIPDAPRGIKFALGENPKRAGSEAGGSERRYPSTRLGVEAVIRRAFIAGRDYAREWSDYEAAKGRGEDPVPPRRDLRLETLKDILDGKVRIHCHSYVASEMLMLMRVCEEFGVRIGTFQHVLEGYKVAPEMAKHGAGASSFADWWAYKHEVYDAIPYNAALLDEAGVVVSINSDSSDHIRRLNLEAAKSMRYGGLSAERALALVTLNPAKQLGIDFRTGSVTVGKDADLAIWSGHPLSVYSRCEATFVEGELEFDRGSASTASAAPIFVDEDDAARVTAPLDVLPVKREIVNAYVGTEKIAIVGGKVFPVSAPPIERGVVLIENGRITSVAAPSESGPPVVPAGFRVIDATGLCVYPGMIDAQNQLGLNEISSVPGSVDTREQGDNQADLRASVGVNAASEHIPVARANGITTSVVRPRGALIQGQGALMHLDGWTFEQMALVDPLALFVAVPGFGRRSTGRGDDDDPRTKDLIEWFERAREYARGRTESEKSGLPLPPSDPRLEALIPYANKERPVVFDADDEKAIVKALEIASRIGVKPIIAGGREAWKVAGLLAKFDVPVLLGSSLGTPSDSWDPYDAAHSNAGVLHRAGVRFAFQTNDTANVRNLPFHAGMAAASGLDKDEALRAVTLRPAQIFGVDHALGSLEAGKIADVVIADGDLLEVRTRVKHLIIHGREVSLETKHTRLYEQYRRRLVTK